MAAAKNALSRIKAVLRRYAAVLGVAAAALAVLAVASGVVMLVWVSLPLVLGSNQDTSGFAAGLNGLAAAAGLTATALLVGLTGWYVQLTSRLVRTSGPDVSISWELRWVDPHNEHIALKANIGDLRRGAPRAQFSEWYVAVTLTNVGSQGVRVVSASVRASKSLCQYRGSRMSPEPLPLRLPENDTLTLYFPASDIEELVAATQDARLTGGDMTARARLGNGRSLVTPPVPIERFEV